MVDGRGSVRAHWRTMLGTFHGLGEGGLQERARRIDRALEDEGLGAVLPGAVLHVKPWQCDPVPLLLQAGEFAQLEQGLAQRARLLSAVLDDLYSNQALLRTGKLPSVVTYASPGFLRPCRDAANPPGRHLQLYAADLVRDASGGWRVLADRPSVVDGLGMARENRRVLGRVFPEAFRTLQVRHQRGFFDALGDALAHDRADNASVALLTPGIADPRWFEHVVLSRELSCTLVEAGDLSVRGGRLFLKTLQGLKSIDVLVRQVEGRLLDPLEMDVSAASGMPGLLDAARDGGVTIANGPGSALAAMPLLSALLPALASDLVGEALLLPGIACLWLGEPDLLRQVERTPGEWIFRRAADETAACVAFASLPGPEQEAFLARLRQRPWEFVASPVGVFGTVPCVGVERLEPRPFVLRLFLTFDGMDWRAMRGGLVRVCDLTAALAPTLASCGLTKDVWVLAEDRGDVFGAGHVTAPKLALHRATGDLPSRVADNLFWLGRYVERLDRAARLLRAAGGRVLQADALSPRQAATLRVLTVSLRESRLVPKEAEGSATLAEALLAATRPRTPSGQGGGLPRLFGEIARLTETVRDRLTDDMYATFVQTLAQARTETEGVGRTLDRLGAAMIGIQRFCTAVSGVAAENMVRGGGFLFLDLGRRLERAHAVTCEVAAALDQAPAQIEGGLSLILELCDSAITYRSRYLNVVQAAAVLDLVLVDQGNPRGLAFQLVAMHDHLDLLNPTGFGRETLAGAAAGVLAQAEAMVTMVLDSGDQASAASGLPKALRGLSGELGDLSDRIVRRYFALLPPVQTVGWNSSDMALQGAA